LIQKKRKNSGLEERVSFSVLNPWTAA